MNTYSDVQFSHTSVPVSVRQGLNLFTARQRNTFCVRRRLLESGNRWQTKPIEIKRKKGIKIMRQSEIRLSINYDSCSEFQCVSNFFLDVKTDEYTYEIYIQKVVSLFVLFRDEYLSCFIVTITN